MPKKLWLWVAIIISTNITIPRVNAISCPDVKIIFARGSGEKRWVDQNYLNFKKELEEKLKLIDLKYEFEDLDFPAIGVGNPWTLLTTFVSGGMAYDFGASMGAGVKKMLNEVNNPGCKNTKYVIAGYSQGAMVVSKAINYINPDKIIYAATFGDPKIYLPEGEGLVPPACRGENLSNYRIYVPDCRAYEGLLGGYKPYQPEKYIDKLGTWCNKTDIFCSTHFGINAHTSYVSDGIYEDASKLIFDKVCKTFGITNKYVSLHDTAILIDSTGSMKNLIDKYKEEALRLAEKTLDSGGRVALYDYKDLNDPYEPVEHCSFETCTLELIENELNHISADGGKDHDESLLSASFNMMKKLNWKYGSTKSVVVLTDAGYHNPDIDGVTFDDVVNLSKKIDPVNFYVIAPEETLPEYTNLALLTGGEVASTASDLSLLTDTIIARYDALPRVEDYDVDFKILPEITNAHFELLSDSEVKISWNNTGSKTIIILNDFALGVTESNSITINDLDFSRENIIILVPISEDTRGEGVSLEISLVPKAPNTGRR